MKINFIIPPKDSSCKHQNCGDARISEGAVMTCKDCNSIVEASYQYGEVGGWYWRERSQRWLNRKLKKLNKTKMKRDRHG